MKEPETRPSMVAISGPAVRTGCSRLARPRDVLIAAAVSPIHPPHDLKTISPHVVLTVAPGFRLRSSYLRTLRRRLSNHIGAAIPRRRRRPRDSSLAFPPKIQEVQTLSGRVLAGLLVPEPKTSLKCPITSLVSGTLFGWSVGKTRD